MRCRFEIVQYRFGTVSTQFTNAENCSSFNNFHFSVPYILGSTKGITLEYKIENFGETAYLAQINITIFELVSFMKIPSSCKLDNKQLLCDINNGSPLYKGDLGFLKISLDTTKLEGTQLLVKANVFSTGDESNENDNHANTVIPLAEFSDVEISG